MFTATYAISCQVNYTEASVLEVQTSGTKFLKESREVDRTSYGNYSSQPFNHVKETVINNYLLIYTSS